MRTKLQKDAVNKFMEWSLERIDAETRHHKMTKSIPDLDNLREVKLGLELLAEAADILEFVLPNRKVGVKK